MTQPTRMFIDGRWIESDTDMPIVHKYDHDSISQLSVARPEHVRDALASGLEGASAMATMPAHARSAMLQRIAHRIETRTESFASTICAEAGKAMKYARAEVSRAVTAFTFAAEEAKRIHGETVPLDAIPAGEHHVGFWVRRPIGLIAAITPFNFPLNLVAHKVAPALAAGNAIVLKPAEVTPMTASLLCEVLQEAGVPTGGINLLHGPGETVGAAVVAAPEVRKVTFTGSRSVGTAITKQAGIKRVTLELGNNAPVIVADDADIEDAARRCALGAFYYSGQVCVSVQRIYVDRGCMASFCDALVAATRELGVGDPSDDDVDVGPMISEQEADRVQRWVSEAVDAGASLLHGGERDKALLQPTIVINPGADTRILRDEVFGPACSVMPVDSFEEAVAKADDTEYGLQAAIFTRDLERVFDGAQGLDFGGVVVNDTPSFRADHMPYGGNRMSGLGREGIRFAVEDMTNLQMLSIRRSR